MSNIDYLIPFPTGSERARADVSRPFDLISVESAKNIASTAIKSPFLFNLQEHNKLQSLLTPRPLAYDANPKHSTHPIPAFLNWYAYTQYRKHAENLSVKSKLRSIDIGGNFDGEKRKYHICARIKSSREQSRYLQTAFRTSNAELFTQVNTNNRFGFICSQGAEHCNYQAAYAFSVNANYDITMEQVVKFFIKHGLSMYDIAMFLPYALVDRNHRVNEEYYQTKITGNGTRMLFSLKDSSFVYEHDINTWRAYLTTTGINCGNFYITSEIQDNISDFCFLRMVKVPSVLKEPLIRVIPFEKMYGGFYYLPDFVHYMHKTIKKGDLYRKLLVVPTKFADAVIKWAESTTDEGFKWTSFSNWARGQSAALSYDVKGSNLVIFQGLDTDIESYDEIIKNLYIYVAIKRFRRTQDISRTFKYLQKHQNSTTWQKIKDQVLGKIVDIFRDITFDIEDFVLTPDKCYTMTSAKLTTLKDGFYRDESYHSSDEEFTFQYMEDTVDQKKLSNVAIVSPKIARNSNPGQCGFDALKDAMQIDFKKALNTTFDPNVKTRMIGTQYTSSIFGTSTVSKGDLNRITTQTKNLTWLSDVEMAYFACLNNVNITMQDVSSATGETIVYTFDQNWPMIYIVNTGGHWVRRQGMNGGYHMLFKNEKNCIMTTPNDPTEDYASVSRRPNKTDMTNKMKDLYNYLSINHANKQWFDISAAPGNLHRIIMDDKKRRCKDYRMAVYKGEHALDINSKLIKNGEKYQEYTDIVELTFKNGEVIIYDNMITMEYIKLFARHNITLITKIDYYSPEYHILYDTTRYCTSKSIFASDYTAPSSGEIYIDYNFTAMTQELFKHLSQQTPIYDTPIREHMVERDVKNQYYKTHKCSPNVLPEINSKTVIKYDFDALDKFCVSNKIEKVKLRYEDYAYKTIDGVAGAAKTRGVCKIKCQCDLIISPIRPISGLRMANTNNDINTYITTYNLINKHGRVRNLYFDEAFVAQACSLGLYQSLKEQGKISGEIILMGDSKQIPRYNVIPDKTEIKFELLKNKNRITATMRCPIDIASLFHNYCKMTSKSQVRNSISIEKYEGELKSFKNNKNHTICFTQDAKKALALIGANVNTATESQGMTTDTVNLYLHDLKYINQPDRIAFLYSAMTRHTRQIIVYGNNDDFKLAAEIIGTNIERTIDAADIKPIAATKIIKDQVPDVIEERVETSKMIQTQQIETILDKTILKVNANQPNNLLAFGPKAIVQTNTNTRISLDHVNLSDFMITGGRLAIKPHVKYYHSKDTLETLNTMITRYGQHNQQTGSTKLLIDGLKHFVRLDKRMWTVTHEEVFIALTDYLVELQKKIGQLNDSDYEWVNAYPENKTNVQMFADEYADRKYKNPNLHDLSVFVFDQMFGMDNKNKSIAELEMDWDSNTSRIIKFIMKKQDKHVVASGKENAYKAGQGVSAWSKILNVMFSGFTRMMAKKLTINVNENVVLSFNKSDRDLGREIAEKRDVKDFFPLPPANSTRINVDTDFTEFDTAHCAASLEAEIAIFENMNTPRNVINLYREQRSKWTLYYANSVGLSKLSNIFMQHSGQPNTLTGNTLFNMMAIGACYRFIDLKLASFKGDDFHAEALSCMQKDDGVRKISEIFGFKIKFDSPAVSEFVANIITPYGFFPDVLRRTVKVISKIYACIDDWEESRINIQDSVNVVNTQQEKKVGVALCGHHYRHAGLNITDDEVEYLFDYLKFLSTQRYEDLKYEDSGEFYIIYTDNFKFNFK